MPHRSNYALFILIISAWFSLLFLVPFFSQFQAFKLPFSFIFALFHLFCHQIPSRSFFVFGQQMPVCQRCFGIYSGLLIGALLIPIIADKKTERFPKKRWMLIAAAPLILDGVTQLLGLQESTPLLRVASGLIAGFAGTFYLLPAFNKTANSLRKRYLK